MMNEVIDLLGYDFFRNALVGGILTAIVCGIIGVYVVVRRLVFISGGITHSSLGGLGLGVYFGFDPMLGALGFSALTAAAIEWMSGRGEVRRDSAIAVFWSFGMAVGIIAIFLKSGFAPNLSDYLFGNILSITRYDIYYLAALSVLLIIFFTVFYRLILFLSFDSEFAKARKMPVRTMEYILSLLIAVTVVLCIRVVGIMLLLSLLTVPQMTAAIFTMRLSTTIFLSIFFGLLTCIGGLLFSYFFSVPSGVSIVFVQIALFYVLKFMAFIFGNVFRRQYSE